ncbi:MAG: NADH-quinone oxidoreductase subunit NuoD, partial [Methanomassiliicoccaceae archaeon]|nr:NADH-quinone oxidoreductase subunit NuoD [Methanomassiliicoccaceae archaeon]
MADMWITMGPQHPFSHGLWTLKIRADGEIVKEAEPVVGYLHRGWEKECENRTYPLIIPMADRLCYSASMTWAHIYCKVVEEALGVELSDRAKYLRVVADEICRIQSHLMWLAAMGTDLGNLTIFLWALREREFFLDLNVKLCGQRLTTNYPRIGGVRNDMPFYFERDCMRVVKRFEKVMWEIVAMMDGSSIFLSRMRGIGIINRKDAANYGLTGPTMRGSGVDFDIRRDDPYCNYDQLNWEVAVS